MRETIILSDLDIHIMQFLNKEQNISKVMNEFEMGHSQCKRHMERINLFIIKRKQGNFRFVKLNEKGKKILEILNA